MRFKDFIFQFYPVEIDLAEWRRYYEAKYKRVKTDYEKQWLRMARKQIKTPMMDAVVTHKPTGTTAKFSNLIKIDRNFLMEQTRKAIKMNRVNNRTKNVTSKKFGGVGYAVVGGTFVQNNNIIDLGKHPHWHDPLRIKVPKAKSVNYIGVEIEFNQKANGRDDTNTIAAEFAKRGLGRYVNVTIDGSCGFEVRTLLPENNWIEPLTAILQTIKDLGFPCDHRCGTHVHLDMRNRDIKLVYKNMFLTQTFLRKFLTKDRKRNKFCMRNTKAEYDPKEGRRYLGINTQSYTKHSTLEIRMHHGTLDINELQPWIGLLLKVVNYNKEINKRVLTLKQARGIFNIDEPLTDVLGKRLNTLFKRKVEPPVVMPPRMPTAERLNALMQQVYSAQMDNIIFGDNIFINARSDDSV